ncbi:MAG: hypothetical protein LBN99_08265 [Oscillospiraceae bacterium]|jgi:hypothetical protein|nr:hypothetical protein [Oscillospiraceae bacterium]
MSFIVKIAPYLLIVCVIVFAILLARRARGRDKRGIITFASLLVLSAAATAWYFMPFELGLPEFGPWSDEAYVWVESGRMTGDPVEIRESAPAEDILDTLRHVRVRRGFEPATGFSYSIANYFDLVLHNRGHRAEIRLKFDDAADGTGTRSVIGVTKRVGAHSYEVFYEVSQPQELIDALTEIVQRAL